MTNKLLKLTLTCLVGFLFACSTQTKVNDVATTPPMGWNSYNCFGMNVTEAEVKANADYMAKNLKDFGYEYVVVDFLWFGDKYDTSNWQSTTAPLFIDKWGRCIPSVDLHPSAANGQGFKPLADYVHGLGLKFGIHIMRGIPWLAVKENTPVKGTDKKAQDIASIYDTCSFYKGMRGIDFGKDGAQQYMNSLFELYAEWGVDFVKVDDIAYPYHADDIEAVHKAIENCGRPMVLSLSPGPAPIGSKNHLAANANMWRISPDFWDRWDLLKRQFILARMWAPHSKPGNWPDADMLPVGKLSTRSELKGSLPRNTHFTKDEQYTMLTLWSMMRSPLIIGADMQQMDPFTLKLLTNKEVIDIDQNSSNAQELFAKGDTIIWHAIKPGAKIQYLAFFNMNDRMPLQLSSKLAGINVNNDFTITDLWRNEKIESSGNEILVNVAPHGTVLVKIESK
jgi:alpha-galactosidase